MITFDLCTHVSPFLKNDKKTISKIKKEMAVFLKQHTMTGWYDVDHLFSEKMLSDIKQISNDVIKQCEALLIIGIGGSYMATRACYDLLGRQVKVNIPVYFLGHTLSSQYYREVISNLEGKQVIVYVVSKSGTTMEVVTTYHLITTYLKQRYGDDYCSRIVIATDAKNGFLREEINQKKYVSFVIPDNIGGRYSVFTAVTLFPLAILGFDLTALSLSIQKANQDMDIAIDFALKKQQLYEMGKRVEWVTTNNPYGSSLLLWYQQLFSESLGKKKTGVLPVTGLLTRDLHSLEQFMQDGNPIIFETIISMKEEIVEPSLERLEESILESILIAHPHISTFYITIPKVTLESVGYLMQMCMLSCAVSGYLQGIDPFDQPGVECYKKALKKTT